MPDIASNIISLKKEIPSTVKLVAVSKTRSVDEILKAYNTGHKIFGENRVQELLSKKNHLPDDIEWHLVGHLQTNKVRYIVPFISMIESVDTFKLLKIINAEASKIGRTIACLLQFHIAKEETKYGFSMDEVTGMAESSEFRQLKAVRICGIMGMATFTSDNEQIRSEFRYLYQCYNTLKTRYLNNAESFREISMGMSGDYKIAIAEGSTIVRIGSIIFGERK
ncbi:MAG: YggS family pyridoxal phosphate-dependent enzyme [Bacteroidales bacterium]|nr:YggS family pyridoxal phosphate-dependent enzyme [Bacteroidales bacterium]